MYSSYDLLLARPRRTIASTPTPTRIPAMIDSTGKPGIGGATRGVVIDEVVLATDSLLVVCVGVEEVLC